MIHVKDGINNRNEGITLNEIKAIRPEDRSASVFRDIGDAYKEVVREKENEENLDEDDVMKIALKTFKKEIFEAMAYFIISSLFRIAFSVLIYYLLQSVQDRNLPLAYIFCSILIVCWYLFQLTNQIACLQIYILSSHTKSAFSMLLYAKVSKLTACVLNSSELGKITNLLSNDLSVIEMRMMLLFQSIAFPVMLFGFTILLVIRLGWISLVGIFLILVQVPISNCIAKKNGERIVEAN